MNVVIISEKDAANVSLARIADAYVSRGHSVVVFATYYAENVLKYFSKNVEIRKSAELKEEDIDNCDLIFTTTVAAVFLNRMHILHAKKPVYTHTYLIDRQVQWGGDLCFVASLQTAQIDYGEYIKFPKIAIGEPKYDAKTSVEEQSNRLLFIDSGHYPFGEKGRVELARTLISICEKFPDYELWIKPRFLKNDQIITHKNDNHIYDIITEECKGDVPSNMVMLKEHYDLKELIDSSHTIICMYTTAFVGAYAANKGLVVIDGLPSDDIYDVRWKIFRRIRECMEGANALIHYSDVCNVLPDGIKCSKEYFDYLLAEKENSADKICEVTEDLNEKYYSKGLVPSFRDCDYKDYKQIISSNPNRSWDDVIKERYLNYIIQRSLILIDFNIDAKLNIDSIINNVRKIKESKVDFELYEDYLKQSRSFRDECIVNNESIMKENDIDSGILLNAYYKRQDCDSIINFDNRKIGAYHLFRGFVAYEYEGRVDLCIDEIKEYLSISNKSRYIKEVSDMSNNKIKAYYMLIKLSYNCGNLSEARMYMEMMEEYYMSLYRNNIHHFINKTHGQHYMCMYWLQGIINNRKILPAFDSSEKIIIYGFGEIAKRMILKNQEIYNRTIAIADRHLNASDTDMKEYDVFELIKPEEIKEYSQARIVLVTVPHAYESIKKDLLEIDTDLKVIDVTQIYEM